MWPALKDKFAVLRNVFGSEAFPVGQRLYGGAVSVLDASASDQVLGKDVRVYVIHFHTIIMPDGQSHLEVGVQCTLKLRVVPIHHH